jgi:predicted lipid-binding transport protein (Tim44 family)
VKRLLVLALAGFASLAMVHADFADAARIGGGRSLGMQRSIAPPAARTAPAPSAGNSASGPAANPVMPARPGATAANPAAAAAPAASGASRWLAPIAGIAAGIGLAALLSHFGLPEGLGTLLLLGLLAAGAIVLVRLFIARRSASASPYQYAGSGSAPRAPSPFQAAREPTIAPAWGTTGKAADAASPYPAGFDPAPFLEHAKQQFRRLQAAYDRGDRELLADVTTPEMHAEIARDIASRGSQHPTEVVSLDADIVEVVREGSQYVASVRFHGAMREDGARDAQPFEETWHLVKPVDGSSGWLLAGIQQYA